jgi:hypothetical protein
MTKKTRLFLLIAAGVLIVGLGTGLVASYMGLPALALQSKDGPDELQYVPEDAKLLAYANVRDVMASELRQKIREIHPETKHNDFEEKTGINIETDIDRVVASLSGTGEQSDREGMLVIASGRFDAVRIEGLAREHGGQVTEYKGKRLITHTPRSEPHAMAVAFMKPGLVAFGTDRAVRQAIDLENGGPNVTDNDEVMGLVRDIDDGNAWAVGRFDAIANRARLPREVANQLPPINWFAATGHVNGGIRGLVRAEARDEAAAQNLRDVVRGFMALARLQTSAKPELNTMLNSLQLGGEGKTVSLEFAVPTEIIDMLGALERKNRRADPDPDPNPDPDRDAPPPPPAPPIPPSPPQPPQF